MAPPFSRTTDERLRRPARAAAWLLAGCVAVSTPAFAQSFTVVGSEDDAATTTAPASPTTGMRGTTPVSDAQDTTLLPAAVGTDADATASIGNGRLGEAQDTPPDLDFGRTNLRENSVDGLRSKLDTARNDAPGIRFGSFVLEPTIGQSFNHETTKTGGSKDSRSYLETRLKGTLTSDWSRHQLTVTGEGVFQRNVSGTAETEPEADLEAELRLDIGRDTTGRLRAGYHFEREDTTDPNAVSGASVQSGIDQYTLGAGLERDFGILRGSTRVDFNRDVYGDAELENGGSLSMKDRNRNTGTWTGRVGYELSPALIPFLEASLGRSQYDLRRDMAGYARSYDTYAGRGGVQFDFSEKLNGELGLGYSTYRFADDRLRDLSGVTLDGIVNWSPQRGTDIVYGLATTLEPSTTAGESGAMVYTLSSAMTHELRSALVARLSNSVRFRNYGSDAASSDQTVWLTGAGLTWDINRALALTGDVSYERTNQNSGPSTGVARIGVGLTLRR